jgi:hypothetical protein
MSSGLTDIPGGIAFAEKIAREDKNLEERAMIAFFAVNHGIRLMDRNRIACQLDSREHQFWYHNYFGGWAFFKSNTSYTKWYPAAVTARVRHPEQTSPVLNNVNGTVITSGYLMNTGGGSYQYTPFLETFCKGDLDTLLAPSVQPSMPQRAFPSSHPSMQPSSLPSAMPSVQPSALPSAVPTDSPSTQPSIHPSPVPSAPPSEQPSVQPSTQPLSPPSSRPTDQPTLKPSVQPSTQPYS